MHTQVRIVGTGLTNLGRFNGIDATTLMYSALRVALRDARMTPDQLDGVVVVPSLSHHHFMEAHNFATRAGLLPRKNLTLRTIDTGGAGPISALLVASDMIQQRNCDVVAVVAGDAVLSMNNDEFHRRSDSACQAQEGAVSTTHDLTDNPKDQLPYDSVFTSNSVSQLPSPVIPNGYDRYAQWVMNQDYSSLQREQLAMCPVLMSQQSVRHEYAMTKTPLSLSDVLSSKPIAPVTNLLECARRADGGAAFILASSEYLRHVRSSSESNDRDVIVMGGGEASGPLYPSSPSSITNIFSCERATKIAFENAQIAVSDIDWFGLYDCFPICLVQAIEAVGLAGKGQGGLFVQDAHRNMERTGTLDVNAFPINTHGGLLAFGAPWEVPAMYNVIEAVDQLTGRVPNDRKVDNARRALVFGNGGIFSHSAVAVLSRPVDRM